MKNILVISMLYPSPEHPHFGVFIKREVESLTGLYSQKVIVPLPWHPSQGIKALFNSRAQKDNETNDVEVIYKKYFPLPGTFFQPVKGFWFFLFIFSLVRRIQKDFDFEIIHAHNVYPEGYCAYFLKKIFNKPLVISCRGNDLHKLPDSFLLRPMIKKALSEADSIITVSGSLSKKAVALGADPDKVSIMPKGVDTSIFKPMPQEDARRRLGLPMNKTIVLSVGWLISRKNPFSFIEILKQFSESDRHKYLFVWVGEGPLRSDMEKEISSNRFDGYIWLVGREDPDEVAIWMNAADIFMLVSFSEGMPNVLYEAMACGIPVIASDVDGAGEIIENMKTGMLVSPDDYSQMTELVLKMTEDNAVRGAIGQNGLDYLLEKGLNWENNAEWLRNKYQVVLGQ